MSPGYNADVICLQEVDAHAFEQSFEPFFSQQGFTGRLRMKKETREGSTIFFRNDKFQYAYVY